MTPRSVRVSVAGWSIGAMLVATAAAALRSMAMNDGHLEFAVDDAYIHLAMAERLAHGQTWGVVTGRFDSASSSPIWTLALAGLVACSGAMARAWPLVLQIGPLVWLGWRFGGLADLGPFGRSRAGRWIIALAPVGLGAPALALTGMEHLAHAAVVVEILERLRRLACRPPTRREQVELAALFGLAAALRMETAFLFVGAVVATLVVVGARRLRVFLLAAVAMAVPVVLIAIADIAGGGRLMPNSITLKSALATGDLLSFERVSSNVATDPLVVTLGVAVLVGGLLRRGAPQVRLPAIAIGLAAIIHVVAANMGVYGRYEGYLLLGLGYVCVGAIASAELRERRLVAYVVVLAVVCSLPRLDLLRHAPDAASGIYRQQYQMGRFLATAYGDQAVAVNDIGEVSFQHDGALVDLEGLGDTAVMVARLDDGRRTSRQTLDDGPVLSADQLHALVAGRGARAIAIYAEAYDVPASWVYVGRWCLTADWYVNAYPCVAFFGPDAAAASELRAAMGSFAPSLPGGITVEMAPLPA